MNVGADGTYQSREVSSGVVRKDGWLILSLLCGSMEDLTETALNHTCLVTPSIRLIMPKCEHFNKRYKWFIHFLFQSHGGDVASTI